MCCLFNNQPIFLEEEPTVKPEEIVITEKYESLHIMTIGINRKRVNGSNEHYFDKFNAQYYCFIKCWMLVLFKSIVILLN